MKLLWSLLLLGMCSLSVFAQVPKIDRGVSHDLAIWRASHYSDVRYKLNLTLEKMAPLLKGNIEVHVSLDETGATNDLILDWRTTPFESDKDKPFADVWSVNLVKFDVVGTGGRVENEHLVVSKKYLKVGENVINVNFASPIKTSGSAITRYIDKEDGSEYLYSLFVPSDASTVFPVIDQPDLKARFQLTLNAPFDWSLVSNTDAEPIGEAPIVERNSKPTTPTVAVPSTNYETRFKETNPISTYLFAFAAGPFAKIYEANEDAILRDHAKEHPDENSISVEEVRRLSSYVFVRKSQEQKFLPHAQEVFRLKREAIKYLETYFDYRFPWPKYDLVLIPEFPFGGMEHAGATFVRELSIIFPTEPTKSDYINRATLIFHETAHQWFGDTVTMRWFDDLWLKEGFAQFMAYKALEKIMPEMNAWKVFYERIKQPAYATDGTKGTTPIYQPIENLSAAKSAYGNIVYNKAPAFLRQTEFYLGEDKFQTAVRAFLKKHEFANATWQDLVSEFASGSTNLDYWAKAWVTTAGVPVFRVINSSSGNSNFILFRQFPSADFMLRPVTFSALLIDKANVRTTESIRFLGSHQSGNGVEEQFINRGVVPALPQNIELVFPNYGDYGYGIFLLDDKSRDYVLKNIQNEKDDFLRSMMWGALWDSVREAELDPREYVELAIKNLPTEKDETITASVLARVSTAMTYYIASGAGSGSEPPAVAGGSASKQTNGDLNARLEALLIDKMGTAPTLGQKITFYRAFLNIASTTDARKVLKQMLPPKNPPATAGGSDPFGIPLKTKDRFDIITRLAILGDPDVPKLLADLEKTETSDDAKRYAYAAHAAFATQENREKFWNDFISNKDISESWIEAAMNPFNSSRHADLSLPYLERALKELPNQKRNRKIFFVNGWLGAFIGGQKSQQALDIVNKFLADNPNLDKDLRLKILENVDVIERAVKIRNKYSK